MYSKLGIRITNEQFDDRIKDSNFIRVDTYVNSKTPIKFKCKICGRIFNKKPKEFNKLQCNCNKRLLQYTEILKEKKIILIDLFYNCRKKIEHKCLKCDNTFFTNPKTVKNSIHGCPFCAGTKISKEDYIKKIPKEIQVIGAYINSYTKIEHKCIDCKKIWKTKPNYILHMKCGCPFCASSKGEKFIYEILDSLNIEFKTQFPIDINSKKYYYDFFIPSITLAIEYDGIQHFESIDYFGGESKFEIIKQNDFIKNEYSIKNNISMLRIPYYLNNNEIKSIILDKIKDCVIIGF